MHTPSEGQELAINFAVKNKYSIIALPPGQGKTLCAVEVARRLKLNALVICPSYARKVWVKEFKNQFNDDIMVSNLRANKEIYPLWDEGVAIISYSLLLDNKSTPKTKRSDWLFEWADLVIFDEVHLIKETDNKRTTAAHKLIYENRVPYVMMLSGTPAKNRIYELYSPIAISHYKKDDSEFLKKYPTWVSFAEQFSNVNYKTIRARGRNIVQVEYSGSKNHPELKEILKECYFKLPDKYLHKLPDRFDTYVETDKLEEMPELIEAFQKFDEKNTGITPDIKAKAALMSAAFTVVLAKDLYLKHGPVVIFTDHIKSCEKIAESLKIEPIHGGVSQQKRARILEEFQNGINKFIVATTQTLSVGISLTISNCMIVNDFPWVSGDLEQLERRILRRGQDKECYYYYVMATNQSKRILQKVRRKARDLKKIDELMEE